jgi:hypothetical protein
MAAPPRRLTVQEGRDLCWSQCIDVPPFERVSVDCNEPMATAQRLRAHRRRAHRPWLAAEQRRVKLGHYVPANYPRVKG